MKNKKSGILMLKLAIVLFALSGMIVFAANNKAVSRALNIARPDVKVQISGVVQRDGQELSVEKVKAVHKGEVLDWKIISSNNGNAPAESYRVVGQIPEGTSFVADSAKGQLKGEVTYSIDNGKTFNKQPLIDEKQADGSIKKVPAPVAMYTHLRFEWDAPLDAKKTIDATYRVRVK